MKLAGRCGFDGEQVAIEVIIRWRDLGRLARQASLPLVTHHAENPGPLTQRRFGETFGELIVIERRTKKRLSVWTGGLVHGQLRLAGGDQVMQLVYRAFVAPLFVRRGCACQRLKL